MDIRLILVLIVVCVLLLGGGAIWLVWWNMRRHKRMAYLLPKMLETIMYLDLQRTYALHEIGDKREYVPVAAALHALHAPLKDARRLIKQAQRSAQETDSILPPE